MTGADVTCLRDLEVAARAALDPAAYDYYAGGAGDEVTVRENEAAYGRLGLLPRVLTGAGTPRLGVTVLGRDMSMPVLVAPTAFHRLAHPEGELATARAAAAAGVTMVVSMAATVAVEEIATAGGDLWFQLYVQPDEEFTESVVRRAAAAGCRALVVTVDSPAHGKRERDLRNGFLDLPAGMSTAHMAGRPIGFRPDLAWEHLDWLRGITSMPIVLKGVVHPADARLALEAGADGIVVSNHGGRQLDGIPATIDLLEPVVAAVDGRIPVLVDGGIRRGTDVLKALALGAAAVGLGRPVLWGLAAGGEAGVTTVLDLVRDELGRALTLCGHAAVRDVGPELIRRLRCPP